MVINSLKRSRSPNDAVNQSQAEEKEEEICTGVLRATPRVTCYWEGRDGEKPGGEHLSSR